MSPLVALSFALLPAPEPAPPVAPAYRIIPPATAWRDPAVARLLRRFPGVTAAYRPAIGGHVATDPRLPMPVLIPPVAPGAWVHTAPGFYDPMPNAQRPRR